MTRDDQERPEPDTAAPTDPPPTRPDAGEATGTWAFISPFAATPGPYLPSSGEPGEPRPSGQAIPVARPGEDSTRSDPATAVGRPDRGAEQPGRQSTGTGTGGDGGSATVGGLNENPHGTPNEDTTPSPTWGPPATPDGPPAWGAPATPDGQPAWGAPVPPTGQPAWGAPAGPDPAAPRPSRWKTWQKVTAGGALAAVVAIGGVAAVSAASASSNDSATSQAGFAGGEQGLPGGFADGGSGRADGGMRGGMAGAMALANALHGDFVVSDGTGTKTMRLQVGELTSMSGESITVRSSDGYTSTYAVGSGVDVSGLSQGESVRVLATVDGDTATVTWASTGATGTGQGRSGTGQGETGMTPPEGMQLPEGGQPPSGMTPPGDTDQAPPTS